RPVLGSTGKAGADIAARFATVARRLFLASIVLAIASGALWLVLIGAEIADGALADVGLDGAAWALLTGTRVGLVSQFPAGIALLLVHVAAFFGSRPVFLGLNGASIVVLLVSLGFVGLLAWEGHGGATPGAEGYAHLASDVLHLVAAAAWLGGLAPLVWLLR